MATGRSVVVVGAGFSGLSAACHLAQRGFSVIVVDNQDSPGGRARVWEKEGFRFDLGPSWYWMPEVFEEFFGAFGKKVEDYYELKRLDPPYKVFFEDEEVDVPDSIKDIRLLFEQREKGSAEKLDQFLKQAEYKYKIGMSDYVKRPCVSIWEFLNPFDMPRLIMESFRLQMLTSQRSHVQSFFKDEVLIKLMEWPVLFLGGAPDKVPAMYSMMNHAAMIGGTWYPSGGMSSPAKGMATLARELGVNFLLSTEVKSITVNKNAKATHVVVASGRKIPADFVVAAADYHHVENSLLPPQYRNYSGSYWDSRVMSPSSLLFFLGVKCRVHGLQHHNLFFDEDLDCHAEEIYSRKDMRWPKKPLFYVCVTSLTDDNVAPVGCENIFVLIPIAPGLEDTEQIREKYFGIVMNRLEQRTKQNIRDSIVVKRSYALADFEKDYHSFKGNAYGLANILSQTAIFKPQLRNAKIRNMFYAGQLTVPGLYLNFTLYWRLTFDTRSGSSSFDHFGGNRSKPGG
eukprot:TRINITY_DN674_c0_g1_i1.p1 TRINITY_DN674_c0_g1~~TRINITY_DN674_c0_g1_i1.p1  ORF type:complete len:512 (-),score=70.27 TRINITY_DN674_c0_g1_i1:712-2247(-)